MKKAYIIQCNGHHCLASHAVTHQCDLLVVEVGDEFGDILSHDTVVHLFWMWTVSMVPGISADDLPIPFSIVVNI